MALIDDLTTDVTGTIQQTWNVRDGQVVPNSVDVKLAGGAVKLNATFLYADLANSTELAMNYDSRVAAKVCRAFMAICSRLIRHHNGDIRSFDGDRVMGIFIGDMKNTRAATCALKINHAFAKVLKPRFEEKYPALKAHGLAHGVGIDASDVLTVRGGIRGNNDLVWIGRAPNIAAKLSNIRNSPYHTHITDTVYNVLADSAKLGGTPKREMWQRCTWKGGVEVVYRSEWTWTP